MSRCSQSASPCALMPAPTIEALKGLGLSVEILSGDREIPSQALQRHGHRALAGEHRARRKVAAGGTARNGAKGADGGRWHQRCPGALRGACLDLACFGNGSRAGAGRICWSWALPLRRSRISIRIARKAGRLMTQNPMARGDLQRRGRAAGDRRFATPFVAAIAMSGSSLLVTMNAMRARFTGGSLEHPRHPHSDGARHGRSGSRCLSSGR